MTLGRLGFWVVLAGIVFHLWRPKVQPPPALPQRDVSAIQRLLYNVARAIDGAQELAARVNEDLASSRRELEAQLAASKGWQHSLEANLKRGWRNLDHASRLVGAAGPAYEAEWQALQARLVHAERLHERLLHHISAIERALAELPRPERLQLEKRERLRQLIDRSAHPDLFEELAPQLQPARSER